jgi:MoaA/NifB/PqqE/SkfB family radical SAM enzyme
MTKFKRLSGYMKKLRIKSKPFLAFQIEPTSKCQLKCVMCPRTVFSDEWVSGDMSISVYKKISRYFHLVDHVHLQGWGEPLLHPELSLMIQIAKAENCRVSLTTNGILLKHNLSEELLKKGLDTIAVSIAGATKETHESMRCGSHFEQVIDNIKTLSDVKAKMGSKTPKLVLSFLITRTNIKELPEAVILAKNLGINELVATNLDYTPTKALDDLKAFSCNKADLAFQNYIEAAKIRAEKIKLPCRIYPLEMEELIMCEMNPLKVVFLSHDGSVSPCVYLNLSKEESIPRVFCSNQYEIDRQCFGNVGKYDFMEIWKREDYKNFRGFYTRRMAINRKAFDFIDDLQSKNDVLVGFEKREIMLRENPLPSVCRTCYKAYNI